MQDRVRKMREVDATPNILELFTELSCVSDGGLKGGAG